MRPLIAITSSVSIATRRPFPRQHVEMRRIVIGEKHRHLG
jgi:hypothetical protein